MPSPSSGAFKPDFKLVLFSGVPYNIHFEAGATLRVQVGADHYQVPVGQLDAHLPLIRSHDCSHDTVPAKDAQRVRDAPKLLQRDLGHGIVHGWGGVGQVVVGRRAGQEWRSPLVPKRDGHPRLGWPSTRGAGPAQSSTTIKNLEGAQNSSGDSI
jgi:hypothetical protein